MLCSDCVSNPNGQKRSYAALYEKCVSQPSHGGISRPFKVAVQDEKLKHSYSGIIEVDIFKVSAPSLNGSKRGKAYQLVLCSHTKLE